MRLFRFTFIILVTISSIVSRAQSTASEKTKKEIEMAETRMFQNMNFSHAQDYYKTDVADDFFTINADGVWADRDQSLADTLRMKMVESAQLKIFDRRIRVYDNVGITNGRAQAFVNGTMVVEFLYTTVFVKRNGKWMYTGWQGTLSKDSPKLPPPPPPQQ